MSLGISSNSTNKSTDTVLCIGNIVKTSQTLTMIITVAYSVLICLILYFNSSLIQSLRRQQSTRIRNLFLILSITDLGVAMLCAPTAMVMIIGISHGDQCRLYPYLTFFVSFPFSFSLFMTMIISLDRCMVITTPGFYSKLSKRYVAFLIPLCLFLSATTSFFFSIDFSFYTPIIMISSFTLVVLLIGVSQVYLIWYVRKKMSRMNVSRHSNIDYNRRMTVTVAMMFFCAVLCNIPWLILFSFITFFDGPNNSNTGALMSCTTLVLYSNSFLNAIIVLKRSSNLKKKDPYEITTTSKQSG